MSYRPYPDADRALRQINRRHRPEPPSEFEQRLAVQAKAALAVLDQAAEPLFARITQSAHLFARRFEQQVAESAPGVLIMHRMSEQLHHRA